MLEQLQDGPCCSLPFGHGKKQIKSVRYSSFHPKEGKACLQVSSREGAALISDNGVRADKTGRQGQVKRNKVSFNRDTVGGLPRSQVGHFLSSGATCFLERPFIWYTEKSGEYSQGSQKSGTT